MPLIAFPRWRLRVTHPPYFFFARSSHECSASFKSITCDEDTRLARDNHNTSHRTHGVFFLPAAARDSEQMMIATWL